jgi:hypothetical protein
MADPAPYSKTILCLANSRRPDGRCFAGKEFSNGVAGAWIRPINKANRDAVTDRDREYEDETLADVLDIVRVPLLGPRPNGHHQEDHQIRDDRYWTKVGRANWQQVVRATDTVVGTLWPNGNRSFHGLNDKVAADIAVNQAGSLLLIEPGRLDLVVRMESQYIGPDRRRVRADFDLNGARYNFVVTDPWVEDRYFAGQDGTYRVNGARLCVSLPEIINGSSTKLVAAVITPERVG